MHFKPFDGNDWESEARFRKRAQFFAGMDWSQVTATEADGPAEAVAHEPEAVAPVEEDRSDSDGDVESSDDGDGYDYDFDSE